MLAGPSGVGKGTIGRALLAREPRMWFSVSATTRAPRPGEVDGVDYVFMTRDEFEAVRGAGGFVESFEVYGQLKGTPRGPLEEHLARGDDVLLEVDVQGAMRVREQMPGALLVFVAPPSPEALRTRLVDRGTDDDEQVARRLAGAEREQALSAHFDAVVVNDDLDRAVADVAAILEDRRARHDPGVGGS